MNHTQPLAVIAGLVLDTVLGEPPDRLHPVVGFGALASRLERHTYRPTRRAGATHAAVLVSTATATGVVLERILGRPLATALAVGVASAHRMLTREVAIVAAELGRGDLPAARGAVARLVGRDVTSLDGSGVARATVESLAENTVDAASATVFWALMGGAPAVFAHRAVNTLDAMVGHRSPRYERFGWASARADDIANWVPARLTALAIALAAPRRTAAIAGAVRRDAHRHPSPNGGLVEAAFAAALGVSLGGTNRYGDRVEHRGVLGVGPPPGPDDIVRAIALARRTVVVVTVLTATACIGIGTRWSRPAVA